MRKVHKLGRPQKKLAGADVGDIRIHDLPDLKRLETNDKPPFCQRHFQQLLLIPILELLVDRFKQSVLKCCHVDTSPNRGLSRRDA